MQPIPKNGKKIGEGPYHISRGGEQMEDSKIIDLYWARSEQAITETAAKYGKWIPYTANFCNSLQKKNAVFTRF